MKGLACMSMSCYFTWKCLLHKRAHTCSHTLCPTCPSTPKSLYFIQFRQFPSSNNNILNSENSILKTPSPWTPHVLYFTYASLSYKRVDHNQTPSLPLFPGFWSHFLSNSLRLWGQNNWWKQPCHSVMLTSLQIIWFEVGYTIKA